MMRRCFIQFDEIQQMGARYGNFFPNGIRKRRFPGGEWSSPEQGLNDVCGTSRHSVDYKSK